MSRNQIVKIAMIVCAVIVVAAAAVTLSGVFSGTLFGYANAEKYTAGEAEIRETVKNLDINWTSGNVTLEYWGGNTIELTESSDKTISEDMKMRWWLDGDTLRVQYAKNGFRLGWNQEKKLTVKLPEGISFNNVSIHATSGDLHIPVLTADTLNLGVTSGGIHSTANARLISAGSTSGSVHIETQSAEVIKASSTSGSVTVKADQAGDCDAGSTSGDVTVEISDGARVKIGSTSGSITVSLNKFSDLEAGSTSGSISAVLPEHPGFTAQIATVSGRIDYNLALSREGDRYICGDGSAKAELGSTSGNILLSAAEN